jgi:membrane fusion protein (multidrug efflux system)
MLQRLPGLLALCGALTAVAACDRATQTAAPPVPTVVVAPVAQRDVAVAQEWVGTTTGNVNAQIYPKVQGYLLKQTYKDGTEVKSGDVLFEIDPRQVQADYDKAKGELARQQAILVKAQQDVKRYTPLAAEGAVSQMELDTAVQARAAGSAAVASAKAELESARLNLEFTHVTAPINGIAGIASAQVGDLVSPTTPLTSISQLDPIKVSVQISELDYLRFARRAEDAGASPGQAARRTPLSLILADGSTYPEKGQFEAAGLDVTRTTGTIQIQAIFPNPRNFLRPGQFAKVQADTQTLPNALLVPARSVTELQGISQVAVVGPDDKVAVKRVTLGPTIGTERVVTEGLAAGDRVIVEGLQKVRNGMTVKTETAEPAVAAQPGT